MSLITRRKFLEDSALAAATAAAFSAGDAWGASKKKKDKEKETQAEKAKSSDLMRVAIIGCGSRGSEHIEQWLREPRVEIAYVVDADEKIGNARVRDIAKRQSKAPQFVQDFRRALDDKSVNFISTATPNHWHALVAIWSMQAGKDVYVEKPACHNINEGKSMVATARKYGRICQTGTQSRSNRGMREAIEYLHAGKMGEVKLARGLCYKRRKSIGPKGTYELPKSVDYNLWAGPSHMLPLTREKFHYDWHWQREWGNGDMGNQGPHQMDIARWGLGCDRLANRAIALGGRLGYEDAGDVANTEIGFFDFGDKSLVFEVRGLETDPLRNASVGVIFYGSEGTMVMTTYDSATHFDLKGNVVKRFHGGGEHFGNFVDAVVARDPKKLHCEVLDGYLSCAHSHLANMSYYLGKHASVDEIRHTLTDWKTGDDIADTLDRTLKHIAANKVDLEKTPFTLGPTLTLDSKAETIVDNPEASAMLTREYRAPFIVPKASEV